VFACFPREAGADPGHAAQETWTGLLDALEAHGADPGHLCSETIFLRDVRRDAAAVLAGRERALARRRQGGSAPRPQVVQQPPASHRGAFELSARALIPHDTAGWQVRDLDVETGCACEDCARSGARLVRLGSQLTLHTTHIPGTGNRPEEQAATMFRTAERLLADCGMTFRHVVRTWIHLRDIDRDYDVLNTVRRRFFLDAGVDLRPASTGVAGALASAAHDVSLSLIALRADDAGTTIGVAPVSTPLLNEAWSYGADFSRGLRVTDANEVGIHVSGTASIDDAGCTVHVGDFAAQADRMLHNIATLLAGQGAGFADVVSGVTYLRDGGDAALLQSIYRSHGFAGFPHVLVEAPLCRSDLLCEAEVLALLPLTTATA
jgi:enamine deaminase RidA (YjgF/YER057c/UK114 family)